MKRLLTLFITLGIINGLSAQTNISEISKNPCAAVLSEDGSFISDSNAVLIEPQFKGGEKKLYKFLFENLNYPDRARERNITGIVVLKFVVEKDGSITNIEISRSVFKDIDEECIRVMQKMPKWKPGTVDGKPARFQYCLPIQFELH